MSDPNAKFLEAVANKNWKIAYDELNGLAMYDILPSLQKIGIQNLRDMRAQMAVYDVWGGPFMARIAFAMDVVEFRKVQQVQPPAPKLPDDQIADANKFLARGGGAPPAGPKRQIRIALFWTQAAKGETLSGHLIQRARELLRQNNLNLDLSVAQYHVDISYSGEILDDGTVALEMAQQTPSFAGNRLTVIFGVTAPTQCDPNKQINCGRLPHGATSKDGFGRPFVYINIAHPHADGATLLHEIGHAAGVQVRDSDDQLKDFDDIMSYGGNRTKIGINMTNKLNRTDLFFIGK